MTTSARLGGQVEAVLEKLHACELLLRGGCLAAGGRGRLARCERGRLMARSHPDGRAGALGG